MLKGYYSRLLATTTECVPYEEDLVESNLSSFPPIWEKASIIDGDRDAQATFAAIKGNIPDISVKVCLLRP